MVSAKAAGVPAGVYLGVIVRLMNHLWADDGHIELEHHYINPENSGGMH